MHILFANCRKNGTSTTMFSSIVDDKLFPEQSAESENVLILVHGYGGTFDKVKTAYEEMTQKIIEFGGLGYDAIVYFYWPASWSKTIGFLMARGRVKEASDRLLNFLYQLNYRYKTKRVTIQAHSLGCAVANEVMLFMTYNLDKTFVETNYVFCAPAITNKYYENLIDKLFEINKMGKFTHFSDNVMRDRVYFPELKIAYSKNDPVLKVSFRLAPGNWTSSAIGYEPSKKNEQLCHLYNFTDEVKSHSGYRKADYYYELMRLRK